MGDDITFEVYRTRTGNVRVRFHNWDPPGRPAAFPLSDFEGDSFWLRQYRRTMPYPYYRR